MLKNENLNILVIDTDMGYSIYPAMRLAEKHNVYYHVYHKETFPTEEIKLLGLNTGINKLELLPTSLHDYDCIMVMDSGFDYLYDNNKLLNKLTFGFSSIKEVSKYEYDRYYYKTKLKEIVEINGIDSIEIPQFYKFNNLNDLIDFLKENKDRSYWIKPNVNIRFESFKVNHKNIDKNKDCLERLEYILSNLNSFFYVEEDVSNKGKEIGGECLIVNGKDNGLYLIGYEGDIKECWLSFSDTVLGNYFSKLSKFLFPEDFNGIVSVEGIYNVKNGKFYVFETNIRLSQPTSLLWFYLIDDFVEFMKLGKITKYKIPRLIKIFNQKLVNKFFNDNGEIKRHKIIAKQVWNRKIENFTILNIKKSIKLTQEQVKNILPQSFFRDNNGKYVFMGHRIGLKIEKI